MPHGATAEQQPNYNWLLQFPWQSLRTIPSYLALGGLGASLGETACLALTTCYPPLWWASVGSGFFLGAGVNYATRIDWGKPFRDLRKQQVTLIEAIKSNSTTLLSLLELSVNEPYIQPPFIKNMLEFYLDYAINETNLRQTTMPKLRDSVLALTELSQFILLAIGRVTELNESADLDINRMRQTYFNDFKDLWSTHDDAMIRGKIHDLVTETAPEAELRAAQLTS